MMNIICSIRNKTLHILIFIFFLSCTDRDNVLDEQPRLGVYKIEMSYTGDIENWNNNLSISAFVDVNSIPTLTGDIIEKTEKISENKYTFFLPITKPKNAILETSNNVTEISINGLLTPLHSEADKIKVLAKVYKNNIYKDEFSFEFTKDSSYPYYNIIAN